MSEVAIREKKNIWAILGPGVLYAAAAVGVSHLVQATRAGADYGLGLTLIIILACIIKYPSLRFGGDYAAATGTSLIASFKAEGWWAFLLYAVAELFSMVFVVAAVSLFTFGLIKAALGFEMGNIPGVALLLAAVVALLLTGKYHLLEKLTKYIVAILTVLIVAATLMVIPQVDWSLSNFAIPAISSGMVLYLVALIGFMPTPPDGSVLQSLWTVAKGEDQGQLPHPDDARLDFNIGYICSVILGLCFLVLGTGVMYQAGIPAEQSNGGFSAQLLSLFTETIGDWAFPLIATAAVFVMVSTLLTVVDGMTRVAVGIGNVCQPQPWKPATKQKVYSVVIVILCIGAVGVLAGMMKSFATFVDMTSVIVFVITPFLAFMNHRAMWSERVPEDLRPGNKMRMYSLVSAWLLTALTLAYFYSRLFM